jgi:hypothetical protein
MLITLLENMGCPPPSAIVWGKELNPHIFPTTSFSSVISHSTYSCSPHFIFLIFLTVFVICHQFIFFLHDLLRFSPFINLCLCILLYAAPFLLICPSTSMLYQIFVLSLPSPIVQHSLLHLSLLYPSLIFCSLPPGTLPPSSFVYKRFYYIWVALQYIC